MIPRTIPTWQSKSWQEELADIVTDPAELISMLKLDDKYLNEAKQACLAFPLRATRSYIKRIKPGDINDPLLKQILPLGTELDDIPGYTLDPLMEADFTPTPGLIHKYKGRVLLVAANQCAINCRYCFRRHFDYQSHNLSQEQWGNSLRYIENNLDIEEVILSGGDPLSASDKKIEWLVDRLASFSHITRLRIHTRLPIVAPSRVTDKLMAILTKTRLQSVIVVHINHPQEIDNEVTATLQKINASAITLLNQSVLLKGVNDNENTLTELSKTLFRQGVLPYYLHLLDKVVGTAHFDVEEAHASSLYKALLANLPGYLVPKLVKEAPNAPSKVPVI